ncbi:uncharacterized protein LOC6546542 isoform X2 [Drosophila erecta]|uniref:uncharacterized protein LOC6546542 isoform X2 n=1 Tax=Drosophila erecta TaxID=7220 RepID=UPI000F054A67|nr:uncharacterized protein LOC6546542 isoform X2 [Drosophila erecta]
MASTRASPDADGAAETVPLAPPSVIPATVEAEEEEEGDVEAEVVDVEEEAEVVVGHRVVIVADRPGVPAIPSTISRRAEWTAA